MFFSPYDSWIVVSLCDSQEYTSTGTFATYSIFLKHFLISTAFTATSLQRKRNLAGNFQSFLFWQATFLWKNICHVVKKIFQKKKIW